MAGIVRTLTYDVTWFFKRKNNFVSEERKGIAVKITTLKVVAS